jgi:hypothetical protein
MTSGVPWDGVCSFSDPGCRGVVRTWRPTLRGPRFAMGVQEDQLPVMVLPPPKHISTGTPDVDAAVTHLKLAALVLEVLQSFCVGRLRCAVPFAPVGLLETSKVSTGSPTVLPCEAEHLGWMDSQQGGQSSGGWWNGCHPQSNHWALIGYPEMPDTYERGIGPEPSGSAQCYARTPGGAVRQ